MDTDTCLRVAAPDPATDLLDPTHDDAPIDMAAVAAASMSDEQLDERLCLLAGRLAVTEAEFLRLLVEFDTRGTWSHLGLRSAANWLSWRLGMGLGAVREKVRVAHALQQLPAVAAAFGEATLSYSKVRALSRVATPVNESELLEVAHGATGAQLERIARAWRRVLVEEDSASATLCRSWRRRVMEDGSVVFTLHVPADDAAVVDAAVTAARLEVLDAAGKAVETPEETTLAAEITDSPPRTRSDADAVVLLAESFCATGAVGSRGDGLEVVLYADLASLLPPALEQDVERDSETAPAPGAAEQEVERDVSAPPPRPSGVLGSHGQPLIRDTALRRMCEHSVRVLLHDPNGRPLDLGRAVRHASRKQRIALQVRDQGCCRFPGCTQTHRLIPHHVDWWSRGGGTDLDNLVLICPSHHRAVHEVGYGVVSRGGGSFAFTDPEGLPVHSVATPLPRRPSPFDADYDGGDGGDPQPWRKPPMPAWGGERLDLGHLINGMVDNTVNRSGHSLMDTPVKDIRGILRKATGWPLGSEAA